MSIDGLPTEIRFNWLDETIEKRRKDPPTETQPRSSDSPRSTKESIAKAMSEMKKRLWADPNGPYAGISETIERLWADPNGPYKNHGKIRAELWANPDSNYKYQGKAISKLWENPDGPYKGMGEKSAARMNDPEYSKILVRKNLETAQAELKSNLDRFKFEPNSTKFWPGLWFEAKKCNLPPLAADLHHDELLFHLPAALKYLDIDLPSTLEKPACTPERPGYGEGTNKNRERAGLDLDVPQLYGKDFQRRSDIDASVREYVVKKNDPNVSDKGMEEFRGIKQKNFSKKVWLWVRFRVFAEDVVLTAISKGVTGMDEVSFTPRAGHWEF
jgi:hypothetical protein